MNSDPVHLAKSLRVRQLLTLDSLALMILVPAQILGRDDYLSVIALLAYLMIALWLPLPETAQVLSSSFKSRISFILRYALILTIATSTVLLPTLRNVLERFTTPIEADGFSPAYSTLSDSAMQTELGLAYLAKGANPYEELYGDTPLQFYQWLDVENLGWHDPAYDYFVYLPANLLLSYPLYNLSAHLSLPYDQRIIFLLFYVILLFVLPQLAQRPIYKLAFVAAVALNPLLTDAVVLGMNDVVVFLALTLAILFLNRQKWGWSFLFMGVACALKQYAWFIAPFYLLYIWQTSDANGHGCWGNRRCHGRNGRSLYHLEPPGFFNRRAGLSGWSGRVALSNPRLHDRTIVDGSRNHSDLCFPIPFSTTTSGYRASCYGGPPDVPVQTQPGGDGRGRRAVYFLYWFPLAFLPSQLRWGSNSPDYNRRTPRLA